MLSYLAKFPVWSFPQWCIERIFYDHVKVWNFMFYVLFFRLLCFYLHFARKHYHSCHFMQYHLFLDIRRSVTHSIKESLVQHLQINSHNFCNVEILAPERSSFIHSHNDFILFILYSLLQSVDSVIFSYITFWYAYVWDHNRFYVKSYELYYQTKLRDPS